MSINPSFTGLIVKNDSIYSGEATKCILLEACLEYVLLSLVLRYKVSETTILQISSKCNIVTSTSTTMLCCYSDYIYLPTVPEDRRQKPACHWKSCWRDRRDTGI